MSAAKGKPGWAAVRCLGGPRRTASPVMVRMRRDERGALSLIELLAVIPLALVVFGSVLFMYHSAVSQQAGGEVRVRSLLQQKTGLERMTRELRQAIGIRVVSSQLLKAQASAGEWVSYECSNGSCRRSTASTEGGVPNSSAVVVINSVPATDTDIFQLYSRDDAGNLLPDFVNPTYVTVTLRVSVTDADNPIVLHDGLDLRNLSTPG
ncbi:hypothetical protein LCGC14_2489270 [marine sediment metagenome]|uniref:Uncharacterized protein n=1 Tax=marine sediment metagenome TaxID=412755 RepID=A0A0F9BT64_9ZZZZ